MHIQSTEWAAFLFLLVCADAKERELFHRAGVPEPTYFGFSFYLLLTACSLVLFANLEPEHALHGAQLAVLSGSWFAFWVMHWDNLAILLAATATILALVLMIVSSNAWLLIWMTYLSLHTFALWSFRRRSRDVRFPGRPISRLSTPGSELSEIGANAYLMPVPNGILSVQTINLE